MRVSAKHIGRPKSCYLISSSFFLFENIESSNCTVVFEVLKSLEHYSIRKIELLRANLTATDLSPQFVKDALDLLTTLLAKNPMERGRASEVLKLPLFRRRYTLKKGELMRGAHEQKRLAEHLSHRLECVKNEQLAKRINKKERSEPSGSHFTVVDATLRPEVILKDAILRIRRKCEHGRMRLYPDLS